MDNPTDWHGASPGTEFSVFTTSGQTPENQVFILPRSWSLISFAIEPSIAHPQHLFGMNSITWGWDPDTQTYYKVFKLEPFKAVWVYLENGGTFNVQGFTPLNNSVEVKRRWNLLGPRDTMFFPGGVSILSPVLIYINGKYATARGVFKKGLGHWVNSRGNYIIDFDTLLER